VNLTEDEARLLTEVASWDGPPLTAATVAEIARERGLNFATALLHEHLVRLPENAGFLRAVRSGKCLPPKDILLGVVPGAFHREHRHTGADGARVLAMARELGIRAEVIPTHSFGTLEENARIIHQWLETRRGQRLALVSLSKGGADVKHALSLPEAAEAFAKVCAWVSFSGTVQGTPLVEWLRRRPFRWWAVRLLLWWRRHPWETLENLRHGPDTPLVVWPVLPAHLRVVHVCGFPLRRHLAHPWSSRAYARLAPLGPNDGGGNLLSDALSFPGVVCPVWGADHYLSPRWDAMPLLTGIVAAALTPRQASESASQPSAPPASRSSA
jgi:hypothetical protein